jgi:NAD(P)H-hydrate epimerase
MIPLFSNDQVKEADDFAVKQLGIPGQVLMENASRSLVESIPANFEQVSKLLPIGIVCGKGNNGGDGFALARQFLIRGYSVVVISAAEGKQLTGETSANYKILEELIKYYPQSELLIYNSPKILDKLNKCNVIIDALLGTGTKGALREPFNLIIKKLNQMEAYKISVDVPSGLSLDSSAGEIIFNADLTITLAELKTGLFYGQGYVNSGKVIKGSIGAGSEYFDQLDTSDYLIEPEDALNGIPVRAKDAHKYSSGKVFIIAGSSELPGAAILATNAAITSGAGAVVLAVPKSIQALAQQKLNEAVVTSYEDIYLGCLSKDNISELAEKIEWADTIVIGPGLGRHPETISACMEIFDIYRNKNLVIDADGIYAVKSSLKSKIFLKNAVITPHYGEFSSLLGIPVEKLKENILGLSKEFCRNTGIHLVLKGAPAIIFTPSGEALINSTGNQSLAKFGSGDVLSGIIGAFIASNKQIENSIISAVYTHGLIADLLVEEKTELCVNATDLIEKIPNAIKFIRNSII